MRTIIIAISFLVLVIVSIPLLLIELLIRKINEKTAAKIALIVVKVVFKYTLFVSGSKVTVVGKENIPTDQPVLYAANHRGFFDIILLYSMVPTQTAFVSKDDLKKIPLIAQWMYFLNCQFINRKDMRQQMGVILNCISLVKKGYSVYIAPEGTRNATDTLLPFKEGSLKIAHKTNCPVVPVCVIGTEKQFEDSIPWVRKGKLRIEFGKPVYLEQLEPEHKKHLAAYVQEKVATMYDANKDFC